MMNTLRKLVLPLSLLVVIGFVLFVINQISGVYLMVHAANETLAQWLLGFLILLCSGLTLWPVVLFMKLPAALKLPENEAELTSYRKKLLKRLQRNELLKAEGKSPKREEDISEALAILGKHADAEVRKTATAVFLTTSISQNGKLDALTVLATQSRMVWKVAHIYYQRPSLRELVYLYAQVAGSSFLASEIEDLDVSQQIEPVITSLLKNAGSKSIPILGPTAHLVMDSLLEGSTNAFLTLRVGNVARKYCGCNEVLNKRMVKRQAFTESAAQLRMIVMKSSGEIISAVLKATKQAGMDAFRSGWEGIKSTSQRVTDSLSETGKKINPFKKKESTEHAE